MPVFDFLMLRIVPDAARGERLNAGVAVFTPTGVRIRLGLEATRLRALDPALARINWQDRAAAIESYVGPLERRLQEFHLRTGIEPLLADQALGQIVADSEEQLEQRIDDVILRFVLKPKASRARREKQRTRLNSDIRRWLKLAKVFSTNITDIARSRVVANYPIAVNANLFAEFALQNGAVHVIETLDFRGLDHLTTGRIGDAAYKSVLLDQAKEVSPQGKRMAVIAADDYGVARPAINMVGRYADDVIAYEQAADRQRLSNFLADALHLKFELAPLLD